MRFGREWLRFVPSERSFVPTGRLEGAAAAITARSRCTGKSGKAPALGSNLGSNKRRRQSTLPQQEDEVEEVDDENDGDNYGRVRNWDSDDDMVIGDACCSKSPTGPGGPWGASRGPWAVHGYAQVAH